MTVVAGGFEPDPEPEGLSPASLRRVIAACDRFEEQWRNGQRPRIESAIAGAIGAERAALLLRLVALELEIRRALGEMPGQEEFLERFPADSTILRSFWSSAEPLDVVDRDRDGFSPTIEPADEPSELAPLEAGDSSDRSIEAIAETWTRTLASYDELTDSHPVGPPLPMPERISRYEVIKLLGEGGFGRVYLAHDETLGRNVAVKVPRAGAFVSPRHLRAFVSEARLAANLKHSAIVTVHDIGYLDDGTPFVVLEYIEGRSLSDLLRTESVSHRRLAELLAQVAEALHHAHSRGLVHRDLKPANILIDSQGRPHVADFGLAVHEESVRWLGRQIAGTLHYMAPEQVRGESHRLDGRTDLWGLGVVLYQMLTGRLPFQGRDRAEVFRAIVEREPTAPTKIDPSLPPGLEQICLKCLSKSMSDRYPTALELVAGLWEWVAEMGKASSSSPSASGGENVPTSELTQDSESIASGPSAGLFAAAPRSSQRLLFEELARVWAARPERSRYLPGLAEWLWFAALIRRSDWTADQARMMRAGAWHHARRLALAAALVGGLALWWASPGASTEPSTDRGSARVNKDQARSFSKD